MNRSTIVYLIGSPGAGKFTIANELLALDEGNTILCDNHLVNNVIFSLLKLDKNYEVSDFAWSCVKRVRDVVFDFIEHDKKHNYIFTNVLNEDEGDRSLFEQVELLSEKRYSIFVPVKLFISMEENEKRIQSKGRKERLKSIDPKDIRSYDELLKISHKNLLELDITNITAMEAAKKVKHHIQSLIN